MHTTHTHTSTHTDTRRHTGIHRHTHPHTHTHTQTNTHTHTHTNTHTNTHARTHTNLPSFNALEPYSARSESCLIACANPAPPATLAAAGAHPAPATTVAAAGVMAGQARRLGSFLLLFWPSWRLALRTHSPRKAAAMWPLGQCLRQHVTVKRRQHLTVQLGHLRCERSQIPKQTMLRPIGRNCNS